MKKDIIRVNLDKESRKRLEALAKKYGCSRSLIIRGAIAYFYDLLIKAEQY